MNLNHLFFLTFLLALGLGGIVVGRWIAWAGITVFLVVIVCQLISLVVTIGSDRARAIGFLIPCLLYGVLVLCVSDRELDYYGAVLPQSQLLQARIETENPWPAADSDLWRSQMQRRAQSIMPLGHLLFSVILGYVGAAYAEHSYTRSRLQNE